jgi:hypothetical protein
MKLRERGKVKESGRVSIILQNITSVKIEDRRMCIKSC